MALKLYSTLSRKIEDFVPRTPGQVKMYVCGPTVYNFLHVGNFRGPVVFNLLRNWLEASGFKVQFALNFTDIDDRIIERAASEKVPPKEISERYIKEYIFDFKSLGLRSHEFNPKVTETLEPIHRMVESLIENGHAYLVDGEVLFSIKSFKDYGKLSHRNTDDLKAGARVEVDSKKRDPLDFSLWKPAKPGEASWPSPWGPGRPGWHIECSAMIEKIFGGQVDIHGGGTDLVFPHHENEIAQSEAANGRVPFAKYWVHSGMLNLSGAKMSKSVGNIMWLRDFIKDNHAEIYKYMILSVHYRSILDFGEATVERTVRELARIYSALALAREIEESNPKPNSENQFQVVWQKVAAALNNDLSTPEAMAVIFEEVRLFNALVKRGAKLGEKALIQVGVLSRLISEFGKVSALFNEEPKSFLRFLDDMLLRKMNLNRTDVDKMATERWQAKQEKNFAKADELRGQLTGMGIAVMDTANSTHWEVAK